MKYSGVTQGESYDDRGNLIVSILVETEKYDLMMEDLSDATRGDVTIVKEDE